MLSYNHPMAYLSGLVCNVDTDLIVLSPYATVDATKALLKGLKNEAGVTLVVRWSKQDIMLGSSDLFVARTIWSCNGRLLRHPYLHAKLFMFDKNTYVFGSANLTSRGMAFGSVRANIECLSTEVAVQPVDLTFVNRTIREAQVVDEVLLEEFQRQVEERMNDSEFDEHSISNAARRLSGLFISDFPYNPSPETILTDSSSADSIHDLAMLGLAGNDLTLNQIGDSFRSSLLITWVRNQCSSPISFGEMSYRIHNAMLDDPKPYRRDIKVVQSNMYRWIKALLSKEFRIWIPEGGHSELIQLNVSR